jgi:hypothetical protein
MLIDDFTRRQVGQEVALLIINGSFALLFVIVCNGVERLRTEEENVNNTQDKMVMDMMIKIEVGQTYDFAPINMCSAYLQFLDTNCTLVHLAYHCYYGHMHHREALQYEKYLIMLGTFR